MKIKEGFVLRTICGENVIQGEGRTNVNFSRLISLNDTAAYLFRELQGRDSFTVDDLVGLLTARYEVEESVAREDSGKLVLKWKEVGLLDD